MNRQQSKCCSSKRHVLESSNALTNYTLQDSRIFFPFPQICGILNTSCNVYNCQPAWLSPWQTGRWCICSDCLARATGSSPLHVQKAFWPNCERSSALTEIRACQHSNPAVSQQFPPRHTHLFSRPGIPTRPHHMAFSPTTITHVTKTCIIEACTHSIIEHSGIPWK